MKIAFKEKIKEMLINAMENDLKQSQLAHQNTKEYVQADDMKQEGKYDTRAIEANYLKDAQAKRIYEIEQGLNALKAMNLAFSKTIRIGSLVSILEDDQEKLLFVSPCPALHQLIVEKTKVLVITYNSPMGEQLLNLEVGDGFEIELMGSDKLIEVLKVE
tara:strand:- start:51192 stop:51671 length:480 start_codon:yes stop_codon:yes gene_type:complete